jgi:hypothetical protein
VAKYDASVLSQYADSLYRKAAWVTFKCGAVGAGIGAIPMLVLTNVMSTVPSIGPIDPAVGWAILIIVGTLIGVAIGQRRSFQYRLQAQTVLCQMQIEYNTRQ